MASMQKGGSSADCWVLTDGAVDPTSLLQSAPSTLALAQAKRPVSSRAAENLFWMGRYTERAENTVRLAQIILRNLHTEEPSSRPLQAWMSHLAYAQSLVHSTAPSLPLPLHSGSQAQGLRMFERALIAALGDVQSSYSVGFNLKAVRLAAANVRERLSQEQRNLIERAEYEFLDQCQDLEIDSAVQEALNALESASEALAGITGAQTDRMVRDNGWRLLSLGRHIERLFTLAQAMRVAFETGCVHDAAGFEALVALFDSTITFHARYQQRRDVVALLDLLLLNRENPRSVAWVLSTLRSRLKKLEQDNPEFAQALLADLPDPDAWSLTELSTPDAQQTYPELMALLHTCANAALALSDGLSQLHFSHAERDNLSLLI
jgi:uncharacterized alpha-E superfamily protein